MARENEELKARLAAAQRQLAEATNRPAAQAPAAPAAPAAAPSAPSETATGILALAQRTADEHIAEARTQADRIVGEARTRAEQLKREGEDKHRQMIGSLETERSALEREVEKLRSFEREYRSRLKSYLEGQLRELDGRGSEAPAGQARARSPGAVRPAGPAARFAGSGPGRTGPQPVRPRRAGRRAVAERSAAAAAGLQWRRRRAPRLTHAPNSTTPAGPSRDSPASSFVRGGARPAAVSSRCWPGGGTGRGAAVPAA